MAVEFDCQPTQYTDYTVATWISDYGRVLSTRNFTLTDAAGREFGRAVTQWAMIDLQSRSAIDLSWVGDAHADAIVDVAPPTDKPRKIRAVSPTATAEHRVVYSDIDFNRHVNTMRYIEMMLDMLPVDMLTQEAPVRLDIHFLKECRFGQTLTVGCELRGPFGAVRNFGRRRCGCRACLYRMEIGLRGTLRRALVERVLQLRLQKPFSLWKAQPKHKRSIR